ncbi:hypothetical protein [Thalassobacillus pellis]|uniref:hypothetical protein n=1 Tax=Thalassobacillus pellis TaxID=748008 RepID=UPI00195F5740|nr:hypothetical protein [Thalassobacillus pellis]MBM7551475.1 hypothetical protein [Thalassobacillus pellis]
MPSFPLRSVIMPEEESLIFERALLIVHESQEWNWFIMVNEVKVGEDLKQYFASRELFFVRMESMEGEMFQGTVQLKNLYEEDAYFDGRGPLNEAVAVERYIELDGEQIAF